MRKKKKTKLYDVDLAQDIRYRGPLSYRHLRILGWLFLVFSQVGVILSMASRFAGANLSVASISAITVVSSLSVPFLLLANFATILDNTDGYKKEILVNGAASGAIALIYLIFYHRYFVGVATAFTGNRADGLMHVETIAHNMTDSHYMDFNLFLDLFLCALFMLFLNYQPKKHFQGKRILIFRLLAILPVCYEAACILLKVLSITDRFMIPASVFPFLTTKPPIMFVVFLILALFIKTRERRFCKKGRTHEEYMQFIKTNRNSLHFSVFTAIVFAIAALVDFILLVIFTWLLSGSPAAGEVANEQLSFSQTQIMTLGIGKSIVLLPMVPVVLLFSYTKTYRNKQLDRLIPIMGIVMILLVYLEGAYRMICALPQIMGGLS